MFSLTSPSPPKRRPICLRAGYLLSSKPEPDVAYIRYIVGSTPQRYSYGLKVAVTFADMTTEAQERCK
jgi:hypothetical protein